MVPFFVKLLEFVFVAGVVGSLIVVILTSIEDVSELGGEEEKIEPEPE